MPDNSSDLITKLLSDKSTGELLLKILGKPNLENEKITDEKDGKEAVTEEADTPCQNEKAARLQKKIDVLIALKPLLGEEFSQKADFVLNALSAAKIILSLKL